MISRNQNDILMERKQKVRTMKLGIYICMSISKAVTQTEWEKVYNETVELVEKLPLAELQTVEIHGNDTMCVVPTKERDMVVGTSKTKGWRTSGDLESLGVAESFALNQNLVHMKLVNLEAGDALLGAIPEYLVEKPNDSKFKSVYHLWGRKTQGEDYHIYLLAVAALVEARLKEKAFTYGDVTKGQFKVAVGLANEYLEKPIDLPDSCDIGRLSERVRKLQLKDTEKIEVLEEFYLGKKDIEYGKCLQKYFGKGMREYWSQNLAKCKLGTLGFDRQFQKYIDWGFELEELFQLIDLQDGDKEENCKKLIGTILDSGLCLQEKNLKNPLSIDVEVEQPYGIATLFAQGIFGAYKNKNVCKYMPLKEVQGILERNFGEEIDVAAYMEAHLKKEKNSDVSEQFSDLLQQEKDEREKEYEEYDIADYDTLMYYEKGDTILPEIQTSLKNSREFLETILEEKEYLNLVQQDVDAQFGWLIQQNRYYCIRKEDWERIYERLKDSDGLARYYSLFRIQLTNQNRRKMATAFLLNDELWNFSGEVEKTKKNKINKDMRDLIEEVSIGSFYIETEKGAKTMPKNQERNCFCYPFCNKQKG